MFLRTALEKFGPVTRTYTTGAPREHAVKNLKQRMELFQLDNDVPVHLKGGLMDKLLYQGTAMLAVIGFVSSIYTVIGMVFKKK